MAKAVSKAQARFFGAVASGKAKNGGKGMTRKEARKRLRGVKMSRLPARKQKK